MDCHVDCQSKTWDFGRGWRGWPKAAFLNTVLSADAAKRLGNDQTSSDSHNLQFYEYNTMDEQGNVVSPASNVLTFTASDSESYETILKADETDRFQLRNVFPDWNPDEDCRQVEVTSCFLTGNTLSWTSNEKAKAFLIEAGGDFVAIVDGTESSYVVSGSPADSYTVRAANRMGGFGLPTAAVVSTGIETNKASMAAETSKTSKFFENGRLVIEKDGMRYNAVGQELNK